MLVIPPPSWEKFSDKFSKFNKFNLAGLFLPGYVLDKKIFKIGIGLIFFWLFLAAASTGFSFHNQVYVSCSEKVRLCENPFYDEWSLNPTCVKYGICDRETLLPGESFGSPPSFFMTHAKTFSASMVFFMLLVNHLLYNVGYFKPKIQSLKKDLKEGKL